MDVDTCAGDSGAPFFKVNQGFGILDSGIDQFSVTRSLGIGPVLTTTCGSPTFYQGPSGALNHLNVHLP